MPIDILPDDVFLEIFNFCLRDSREATIYFFERTPKWYALVHVCQRWRRIIFASPRRLALYLNCTRRTPVRNNLSFWPATLPLIIDYPGPSSFHPHPNAHRPLWEGDDIVAALEHPSRVHRIVIHEAGPLISEVTTIMQKSFPALKHLDLEWDFEASQTAAPFSRGWPISGKLLGGSSPHLQYLRLKRISFPQLPMFLLSAPNLVALELKSISENDYIPTEAIVRSLAALTKLETLSITFYKASPLDQNESRSDLATRTILPALTNFRYRGYCEYLEDFLAQITTPLLDDLRIEYVPEEIEAPQLSQFIDRTENFKLNPFRRAEVMFYSFGTTVQLNCSQECRKVQLFLDFLDVEGLEEQVPYVTNALGQLVSTLENVVCLFSYGDDVDSKEMESIDWLPFFRIFQDVTTLKLCGSVAIFFVSALEEATDEMVAEVFPALNSLCVGEEVNQENDETVEPIDRFLFLRQFSGCPIDFSYY